MRFIHIADLHLDSKFDSLASRPELAQKRRLEQREIFTKVIEYAKNNNVDYIFIAGDLYEDELVKQSSIEYINRLFKEIPSTRVFIAPGNHDPYLKGSIYDTYTFNSNVVIFDEYRLKEYETPDCYIYGAGFTNYSENEIDLSEVELSHDKPNILVLHANLNGNKESDGNSYNPISERVLEKAKFDYVALGHIHKTNFEENKKIVYCGSPISIGFDEPGEHGMIVGECNGSDIKLQFISLDMREFKQLEIDVKDIVDEENLIEKINKIVELDEKQEDEDIVIMYEIYLKGKRSFDIDVRKVLSQVDNNNILKIKDKTKMAYDIEKISKENTLKGLFVQKALQKEKDGIYSKEDLEKAIEIGLDVM